MAAVIATGSQDPPMAEIAVLEARLHDTVRELERLRQMAAGALDAASAGDWTLDATQGELRGPNGLQVRLTASEAKLVDLLLRAQSRVVPRAAMLQALGYGIGTTQQARNVDTHVKRLRDKLEACGVLEDPIETAHGFGYRWKGTEPCQ
jgi:two-component system alkaline phosphatase synthesis response regulator PhoP